MHGRGATLACFALMLLCLSATALASSDLRQRPSHHRRMVTSTPRDSTKLPSGEQEQDMEDVWLEMEEEAKDEKLGAGITHTIDDALESLEGPGAGDLELDGNRNGGSRKPPSREAPKRFTRRRVSGVEKAEMRQAMESLASSNAATSTYSKKKRPRIQHRNVYHNRPPMATARIPVYLGQVHCPGPQMHISQCRSSPSSCKHNRDVGVCCKGRSGCVGSTMPHNGVRITMGDHNSPRPGGRVEILRNRQWGTICDDFFNQKSDGIAYNHPFANTVCRSLGMNPRGSYVFRYGGKGRPKAGVSKHEVEQISLKAVDKFRKTTLDFKIHWDRFTQYTNAQNRAMDGAINAGRMKSKYRENEVDRKRSQLERKVPYMYNLVRNEGKNQDMSLMSGLRRYTWRFNANVRGLQDTIEQDVDTALGKFQEEKGLNFKRYVKAISRLADHDRWHNGRMNYASMLLKEFVNKERSARTFIKRSDATVRKNTQKFVAKLDSDCNGSIDSTNVVESGLATSDMMISKQDKDLKKLVKDQGELSVVISSAADAVDMVRTIMAKMAALHGELHKEFTADDTYAMTVESGVKHARHLMKRLEEEWDRVGRVYKQDARRIRNWMDRVVKRLNKVMDVIQKKAMIIKKSGDSSLNSAEDAGPPVVTDKDKEDNEGTGADDENEGEKEAADASETEDSATDENASDTSPTE